MNKRVLIRVGLPVLGIAIAGTALAQKLTVKSSVHNPVLLSENTDTSFDDRVAVRGKSIPQPTWGIGGSFEGGWVGVSGTSDWTGGRFTGKYSGVSGTAVSNAGFTAVGAEFTAFGGTTNYGVVAYASGGPQDKAAYFDGDVVVTGSLDIASDSAIKKNIRDLPSTPTEIGKFMQLAPKTFEYKDTVAGVKGDLPDGTHTGFVAQEVQKIYPQMVKSITVPVKGNRGETKSGTQTLLTVDYLEMIPLLVNAVQEQQKKIAELEADVKP